jgi:hypothetical protein
MLVTVSHTGWSEKPNRQAYVGRSQVNTNDGTSNLGLIGLESGLEWYLDEGKRRQRTLTDVAERR